MVKLVSWIKGSLEQDLYLLHIVITLVFYKECYAFSDKLLYMKKITLDRYDFSLLFTLTGMSVKPAHNPYCVP